MKKITKKLKIIFSTGRLDMGLELIAFGTLFTWAWEELFQGVNYFRRALGLIQIIGLVASNIQ